jgi:hypothetical protein
MIKIYSTSEVWFLQALERWEGYEIVKKWTERKYYFFGQKTYFAILKKSK